MIYQDLLLNKHIFNNLLKYKKTNKLPNAFIFHGDDGIGKEGHAIEFFAALNCQENKINACGFCKSCSKIKKLQHENLEIIFPLPRTKALSKNDPPLKGLTENQINLIEENFSKKGINPYHDISFDSANTILINSIREIKKTINLSLSKNIFKVYLILQSEKLCHPNTESANALLKILEEPPDNTLFILITTDISMLIDTLVSRCSIIYFPKINPEQINTYLDNKKIKNSEFIAKICTGNIKNAITLSKCYEDRIDLLKKFIDLTINSEKNNFEIITSFLKTKKESIEFLKLVNIFMKDLLIFQKNNNSSKVNFIDLRSFLNNINLKNANVNWSDCIILINNAQNYILKNGLIDLILISLILEIRKVISLKFYNVNFIKEYLNYQT